MSSIRPRSSIHIDRCCNPFGRCAHKGLNLRKIFKKLLENFSDLPETARICYECRQLPSQHGSIEFEGNTE